MFVISGGEKMKKINALNLGIAIGAIAAIYFFLLGLIALWFDWGTALVQAFSSLYIGYSASYLGSLIGAVWGFVDGFIAGIVIAWIYNKLTK